MSDYVKIDNVANSTFAIGDGASVTANPMVIYLPITYNGDNEPHIRQPHTNEQKAREYCEKLARSDYTIWRYEVCEMEVIQD